MTDKKETSRHWILDAIECLKNCEAIVSHCKEIMNAYHDAALSEDLKEEVTPATDKYEMCNRIMKMAVKARRKIMSKMFEQFEWDHQMWCIFKHSIMAKQYIEEVNSATDDLFDEEEDEIYKFMSLALSQFIWEEPGLCARCIADDLLSKEDNNEDGRSA